MDPTVGNALPTTNSRGDTILDAGKPLNSFLTRAMCVSYHDWSDTKERLLVRNTLELEGIPENQTHSFFLSLLFMSAPNPSASSWESVTALHPNRCNEALYHLAFISNTAPWKHLMVLPLLVSEKQLTHQKKISFKPESVILGVHQLTSTFLMTASVYNRFGFKSRTLRNCRDPWIGIKTKIV